MSGRPDFSEYRTQCHSLKHRFGKSIIGDVINRLMRTIDYAEALEAENAELRKDLKERLPALDRMSEAQTIQLNNRIAELEHLLEDSQHEAKRISEMEDRSFERVTELEKALEPFTFIAKRSESLPHYESSIWANAVRALKRKGA